jgi:hypothetical protein
VSEASWSAAAKLPPWNPGKTAVAGATALRGAARKEKQIIRFAQDDLSF